MATSKSGTKGSGKGGAKKSGESGGRGGNQGIMKPVQPDRDLAAIVGEGQMPRTEITKKVWDYIKKNGLQDSANKRMINADDKLGKLFGGKKQVTMFEMTKLVNQHIQ